ncbi:hypothetical protein F8S09_13590 [Deinococcus sp. SDU3-2]|uniref:Uncharacterized protein n=1 Tax=Deinococcus terrestris TaxID=2651870 RepID=A0A7X1NXN1_9DEIO|nr:hypothetical protein [Deinococcus terrestris]MPY67702.1 hypothetical protein [Deinococcus terrestris]
MTRPLSTFPWQAFYDHPDGPVRGIAVGRVRDGIVLFRSETDGRQIMVREALLYTGYDLTLSSGQEEVLTLISAHPDGYAWEYHGKLPGTHKKPTAAQQKALASLVARGVLHLEDGRYLLTNRGEQVQRLWNDLGKRRGAA